MTKKEKLRKRSFNPTVIKILAHPGSIPSALILKNSMQTLLEENGINNTFVLVTKNPEKIKSPLFIRYGCSLPAPFETIYNSAEFIRIASDKLKFSELIRKAGMVAPEFFSSGVPEKYPVLIRTSLMLSKGKGIILIHSEEEFKEKWKDGYFWTPFFSTNFEIRAHILEGNIVKLFRKKPMSENETEFPIRNLDNGYHFSMRPLDLYPKIKEPLEKIGKLLVPLGGNFFTLDAGWCREIEKYVFYEANSGSGLNENTSIVYAKFLVDKLLNRELKFKSEVEEKQIELPLSAESEIVA